jgi:hypothetical protein
MSKGQIDMMGLVVIVILLALIGLFSLFFVLGGGVEEENTYYSLRVYNFANALSKASIRNSNFEAEISSCCSGNGCNILFDFVEDKFELMPENEVGFEINCRSGYTDFLGNCTEGTTSEYINFGSGDKFRTVICRK